MLVLLIEIKGIYNIVVKDLVNQVVYGVIEDKIVSDGFFFMMIFKDQFDQKN